MNIWKDLGRKISANMAAYLELQEVLATRDLLMAR